MPRNTITKPRYINEEILAQRISEAAEWDKQERLEQERMTMEKVRGLGDKETKLYQRINQVSQNDSAEKRRTELNLKEKIRLEEERQAELVKENEELKELKALQEESGDY